MLLFDINKIYKCVWVFGYACRLVFNTLNGRALKLNRTDFWYVINRKTCWAIRKTKLTHITICTLNSNKYCIGRIIYLINILKSNRFSKFQFSHFVLYCVHYICVGCTRIEDRNEQANIKLQNQNWDRDKLHAENKRKYGKITSSNRTN